RVHEIKKARSLQGGTNMIAGDDRIPHRNVLVDRSVQQCQFLRYVADIFAPVLQVHFGEWNSVDENPARGRLVKSHEQIDDGGLAGPGRTGQNGDAPGRNLERYLIENGRVVEVEGGDR